MVELKNSRIQQMIFMLLIIVGICPFVIGKLLYADNDVGFNNDSNKHFIQETDANNSLWPLQVGQIWVYIVTDSRESSSWTNELHILERVTIDSSEFYHIGSHDLRADEWETGVVFINSDENFVYKWDEDEYSVWPREEMVAEHVDVPYGQFDSVYYDEGNYYNYFVPGVGLVKTHQIEDEYTVTSELVEIHPPVPKTIIYVDDDAVGANDGTSWENAYTFLQEALADANSSEKPVEIRVAQGVYKPDRGSNQTPGDCDATFQLINGVTLVGGYAGLGETDPNAYNIELYQTILSGDLDGNDSNNPFDITRAENSHHVLTAIEADETAVLKGFTITKGNGFIMPIEDVKDGGGMFNENSFPNLICCTFISNSGMCGGAMYNLNSNPILTECEFIVNGSTDGAGIYNNHSNPKLINCIFTRNFSAIGSGMSNFQSSPNLTNCIFNSNISDLRGGGIFNNQHSNSILTGCKFTGNKSAYGGGIYNEVDSMPILKGCTLSGNSASIWGGGMYNELSSYITLTNCTFIGNSAEREGDGIFNYDSNLTITNCILRNGGNEIWHDDDSMIIVIYSNVQGGWEGQGNIDEDPLFAEPGYWADVNDLNIVVEPNFWNTIWVDGNYHLKSEMGRWDPNSQSWVKDDVTSPCIDAGDPNSDFSGETWPNGSRINMGAYGGTKEASMSLETGGMMLPKIAFIYSHRFEEAESFDSLLEAYGCFTTLIKLTEVTMAPLDSYDLIIVADDTQHQDPFSDPNAIAAIEDSGKPIVGLGDGGYDFFGQLGLSIGNPYGGHGSKNSFKVADPNNSLFSTPYSIEIQEDRILRLYTETNSIGIYLWPTIPESVTVLGNEVNDVGYFPLVMEHNRYLLWGFTDSPQKMTEVGKTLFINVVIWTANKAWESEN